MLDTAQTLELYRYADLLARKLADAIGNPEYTADELVILHLIDQGTNRPSQLAEAVGKEPPTISHVLTRFRDAGLITSERVASDGRGRVLALTAAGHAALVFAFSNLPQLGHGPQLLSKLRRAATAR